MSFDPTRDLKIEVRLDEAGSADLETNGMAKQGRPDLCMLGIPEARVPEAGAIINLVAHYIVTEKTVAAGERVGMPNDAGMLVVKLLEHRAPKRFLGFFGSNSGVQRIVDGWTEQGIPWIALSTVLLWKARHARESGDPGEARRLLNSALDIPRNPAEEPPVRNYNWNGALAAEHLAALNDGEMRWLVEAVERSEQSAVRMLGDPLDALSERMPDVLEACATVLIGKLLAAPPARDAGPVQMGVGPLALEVDGRVHLDATVLPSGIMALLTSDRVRAVLGEEGVAPMMARVAVELEPLELWKRCQGALELYGTQSPMPMDLGLPWIPGTRLVSMVIAESIRCIAAGCEAEHLLAHFGVDANAGANAELDALLRAFEASLTEYYARALQP